MEKLIAQAQVYYIVGYGRDRSLYDDKKWILGRIYLTNKRILFKKLDRFIEVKYDEIVSLAERDKYPRISPPMGWSRANILEIKHYEFGDKRHILTSLISASFDVTLKLRAILTKMIGEKTVEITEKHKKILLLLYTGMKDNILISYLLDMEVGDIEKIIEDLKFMGLLSSDLLLTAEGTKIVNKIKAGEKL
ncbi:hypothetical protein AciM339_0376 [Aciduliprofundum sp. MAR08-339]|uniref:hypothetical protein n=1 Tax=Aciduliprofundum sp. (strain MAR08-339) TaxID=673860 RepID=UPI0002A4904D|nr:hypothetical protein AciM339_0376 [Aciduliprofundum sp. MAR08-339]